MPASLREPENRTPLTLLAPPAIVIALFAIGCPPPGGDGEPNTPDDNSKVPTWSKPFDDSNVGALSSCWGSGPNDVFIVGGTRTQAEIYHYDGSAWTQMNAPSVGLLVWVFGFGPDDVYAVGVDGAAAHWDGTTWKALNPGTKDDLWGIWGRAPGDMWIVGGSVAVGPPVLMHFDGVNFVPAAMPENDRNATALFKVWGIGAKVFAVGERGLIIEHDGSSWSQVLAGANADEDFVSLWGVSESNIVAVGGRSSARVAQYDGTRWNTLRPSGVPGLNGTFMVASDLSIVGGQNGYLGAFNPGTGELNQETASAGFDIHAVWGDGAERVYAVGGRFSPPFKGLALLRTLGPSGITPVAPLPGTNPVDNSALQVVNLTADCNGNGQEDADDLAGGTSSDCDTNGVPDECQSDADGDGVIDPCDRCAGAIDGGDADADGVPDGCDRCSAGDDSRDADGDGVADACDRCPGSNDALDSDADGAPDACDMCPGSDDTQDSDQDGVPNGCDECPSADDGIDSDGDGVADGCDRCPGFNDAQDADQDGIPNGCDTCVGGETDSDGDGTPDACDICPGFDDSADTDGDGAPNGCDRCPGSNDSVDSDSDGVPDGCDQCPGSPDSQDADGDSVPNGCDACPGNDDTQDADHDGTPDACDACPNDANDDSDGDGSCDSADLCPGFDDNIDCNFNGVADGCDCFATDCPLGQDCDGNGNCAAVTVDMALQDPADPNDPFLGPYRDFAECSYHVIICGFQGLADEYLKVLLTGFADGARVDITHSLVTLTADGNVDQTLCTQQTFSNFPLSSYDSQTGISTFNFARTIPFAPATFDGRRARIQMTFTDHNNASITTSITLYVTLSTQGVNCQ